MDEQAIFKALGIDPNKTEGANTQAEGAAAAAPVDTNSTNEPADDGTGEGENGQGNAAPAPGSTTEDGGEGAEGESKTAPQAREPKGKKDPTQAERRRQQEMDQRIQAEVERRIAEERKRSSADLEQIFQEMNLRDTKTGKPIKNLQEFRDWRARADDEKLKRDLKDGKLSQDVLQRFIDRNPTIQEAKRRQQEEDTRRRQEENSKLSQDIQHQIEEINKLDPSLNLQSPKDFTKMENYGEFYQFVKRGLNFLDAYKLLNFDRLVNGKAQQQAEAAKQQALNNARGKDHLQGTKSQGKGSTANIPADELKVFRAIMPRATDKEIQEYWARNHKKEGK